MTTRVASKRYSTLVAWTKIVLPLAAIGILSTLFLFAGRPDPEDALIVSEFNVSDLTEQQRMGRPRFAGTLEGGQALRFTAEHAAALADSADLFAAENVAVRLTLEPGLEALVDANDALVDMVAQTAQLMGCVFVRRTDGLRLRTEEMMLGLASLSATSGAVEVTGPGLTLDAAAMRLTDEAQMHFTGGVRVLYDPQFTPGSRDENPADTNCP